MQLIASYRWSSTKMKMTLRGNASTAPAGEGAETSVARINTARQAARARNLMESDPVGGAMERKQEELPHEQFTDRAVGEQHCSWRPAHSRPGDRASDTISFRRRNLVRQAPGHLDIAVRQRQQRQRCRDDRQHREKQRTDGGDDRVDHDQLQA